MLKFRYLQILFSRKKNQMYMDLSPLVMLGLFFNLFGTILTIRPLLLSSALGDDENEYGMKLGENNMRSIKIDLKQARMVWLGLFLIIIGFGFQLLDFIV